MIKLPSTLHQILRIILAGVFIYASLDKIWQPALFAKALYNYRILPDMFLYPIAILLPWLEMITGVMLLANIFPKTNSGIQLILLTVFTLAVTSAILRCLDIQCGCFSLDQTGTRTTVWKIGENILLLILAWLVWQQYVQKSVNTKEAGI